VGEEFIPLSVSQFGQTIQNIQKAKPDFVMTLLVGNVQSAYFEQQASASLNLPMGSSIQVGQAYEHKRFRAPALKDMYVTTNYIEEVDTPASNDFKKRFRKMFPGEPYITQEAENAYNAVYLYKAAAEAAGSTEMAAVRKAFESKEICVDGPSGKVCMDPKSHHLTHTIYLAHVKADHTIEFPKTWSDIKPYWLGDAGCNLPVKSDRTQYTPSNPPKK
jgi:urea transport system substrate-binding protein